MCVSVGGGGGPLSPLYIVMPVFVPSSSFSPEYSFPHNFALAIFVTLIQQEGQVTPPPPLLSLPFSNSNPLIPHLILRIFPHHRIVFAHIHPPPFHSAIVVTVGKCSFLGCEGVKRKKMMPFRSSHHLKTFFNPQLKKLPNFGTSPPHVPCERITEEEDEGKMKGRGGNVSP